jgi:hypothetical protein
MLLQITAIDTRNMPNSTIPVDITLYDIKNDTYKVMVQGATYNWQPNCHINYFSYSDLKIISSKFNMKLNFFSYKSLADDSSVTLKIKTLLGNMGPHVCGLYTYFVKK